MQFIVFNIRASNIGKRMSCYSVLKQKLKKNMLNLVCRYDPFETC